MTNWLKSICKVLRHPKSKQIIGKLIMRKDDKIIGKCAMGELGCRIGFKPEELESLFISQYKKILSKYGVPRWILNRNLPAMGTYDGSSDRDVLFADNPYRWENISDWIYELNDEYKLTEPQIADFLEVTFGDCV